MRDISVAQDYLTHRRREFFDRPVGDKSTVYLVMPCGVLKNDIVFSKVQAQAARESFVVRLAVEFGGVQIMFQRLVRVLERHEE